MENKLYIIKKKFLADALNYLGFNYTKYTDDDGRLLYGFQDSRKFREAMEQLVELKREFRAGMY